jgi:hypothetical protein
MLLDGALHVIDDLVSCKSSPAGAPFPLVLSHDGCSAIFHFTTKRLTTTDAGGR